MRYAMVAVLFCMLVGCGEDPKAITLEQRVAAMSVNIGGLQASAAEVEQLKEVVGDMALQRTDLLQKLKDAEDRIQALEISCHVHESRITALEKKHAETQADPLPPLAAEEPWGGDFIPHFPPLESKPLTIPLVMPQGVTYETQDNQVNNVVSHLITPFGKIRLSTANTKVTFKISNGELALDTMSNLSRGIGFEYADDEKGPKKPFIVSVGKSPLNYYVDVKTSVFFEDLQEDGKVKFEIRLATEEEIKDHETYKAQFNQGGYF